MPAATIADVLAELDAIIARARNEKRRTGYFAVLYREVTQRVDEGIRAGRFEDGARMERLDVVFANRYLDAFARHASGQRTSRCWEIALREAEEWNPLILQHLLLGINAHINLDLAIAAAETAPGGALPALQRDFEEITRLLGEMLDEFQERIGRVSPWLWILDRIGDRIDEDVFSFVLARAREFSWRAAQQLAAAPVLNDAQIEITDHGASRIADAIRKPAWFLRPLLLAVRMREPNHPAEVIDALSRA